MSLSCMCKIEYIADAIDKKYAELAERSWAIIIAEAAFVLVYLLLAIGAFGRVLHWALVYKNLGVYKLIFSQIFFWSSNFFEAWLLEFRPIRFC